MTVKSHDYLTCIAADFGITLYRINKILGYFGLKERPSGLPTKAAQSFGYVLSVRNGFSRRRPRWNVSLVSQLLKHIGYTKNSTPKKVRHFVMLKLLGFDYNLTVTQLFDILEEHGLKEKYSSPTEKARALGYVRFDGHLKLPRRFYKWRWNVQLVSHLLDGLGYKRIGDKETYLRIKQAA